MTTALPLDVLRALQPTLDALRERARVDAREREQRRLHRIGVAAARYNGWDRYGQGACTVLQAAFPTLAVDQRMGDRHRDEDIIYGRTTAEAVMVAEGTASAPLPVTTPDAPVEDDDECYDDDCQDEDCSTHHGECQESCLTASECSVCDETYGCCGYCERCEECHGEGCDDTRDVNGETYCRECDHACTT